MSTRTTAYIPSLMFGAAAIVLAFGASELFYSSKMYSKPVSLPEEGPVQSTAEQLAKFSRAIAEILSQFPMASFNIKEAVPDPDVRTAVESAVRHQGFNAYNVGIEASREIQQQLKAYKAYMNDIEYLIYGVPIEMTVLLQPPKMPPPKELLKSFPGTPAQPIDLKAAKEVSAHLSGPAGLVEITLRPGQTERRALTPSAQWIWDVKALTDKPVTLNLEVLAHVTVGKEATPFTVSTLRRQFEVKVKLLDRVMILASAISPLWAGLVAVCTAVGGVLAWLGWKASGTKPS